MFIKRLLIALFLLFNTSVFAADSTVTSLTAASALSGSELFYCVQGGADRKCTGTQISTFVLTTPNIGVATGTSLNLSGALLALTFNGNTFTSGTGTLTLGASKIATISNTLTLTATDGSTLAIGTGGTLGTNAYTSTAYAPLASPTFTGTVIIPTPFTLGAISVTSTGTQLNYLNAASGTTGTASTNIVFSTSPSLTTPSMSSPTFSGTVVGSNTIPLTILAQSVANTMLGNWTGSTANVLANVMPSCSDTGGNHLNYVSGTGITCGTSGGAAGSIVIGTTTIASGTTGRVLYNNAGVLGDLTVSGSGSVAFTSGPTFVTPILGAATATSINGLVITSSTGILTITNAKTLSVSNTLTFTGTDNSSIAFGAGGTIQAVAYSGSASDLGSGTLAAARGGAGTINGALAGNGSGTVSQAASTQLSDVTAATTWTPTDGSGVPLTFTSPTGNFSKGNKTCIGNFRLIYPVTADTSIASINLPCTTANNGSLTLGSCWTTAAATNVILIFIASANVSKGSFINLAGSSTQPTNAGLSTLTLSCEFSFITT